MKVTAHHYEHGAAPRVGVLLANLGTPDAPTKEALKPYLKEFLSDPRVIEVNRIFWWCLLNGVILQTRPAKSAELYKKVWTPEGSPLLVITKNLTVKVSEFLSTRFGNPVEVAFAMRYGNPSIGSVLRELRAKGVTRLVVLPMYPQYSATTTASTFDAVAKELTNWRLMPELRFITQYHDNQAYIAALAATVSERWQREGKPQLLVMSFHGMPKRYLLSGDPYHCHCHKTARLVAEKLGISPGEYLVTFQSLFGREEWLKPYTDVTLKSLPGKGITKIDVICPGFSADCLETLEEIEELNRENFLHAGGEQYRYIPALNDSVDAVNLVGELVREAAGSWFVPRAEWDESAAANSLAITRKEYERLRKQG